MFSASPLRPELCANRVPNRVPRRVRLGDREGRRAVRTRLSARGSKGSCMACAVRPADGRRVHKSTGPAWTQRGRPAAGTFTKRTAEAWLRDVLGEARRGTLPGLTKTGPRPPPAPARRGWRAGPARHQSRKAPTRSCAPRRSGRSPVTLARGPPARRACVRCAEPAATAPRAAAPRPPRRRSPSGRDAEPVQRPAASGPPR